MHIEILPELWLGDKASILDGFFLENKNIKCIINCSKHLKFNKNYGNNASNIRIEIDNENPNYNENMKLLTKYNYITELIHKYLVCNKSVLIFCNDGSKSSIAIIIAYLMRYGKINLHKCIEGIESKCKNINVSSFLLSLQNYEKNLHILYKQYG